MSYMSQIPVWYDLIRIFALYELIENQICLKLGLNFPYFGFS